MNTNDTTLIGQKSRFLGLKIACYGALFFTAIAAFFATMAEGSFSLWHLVYGFVTCAIGMEFVRCVLEMLRPARSCLEISPSGLLLKQPSERALAWSDIDSISSLDRRGKGLVKISAPAKAIQPATDPRQPTMARPDEFIIDTSRLDITRDKLLATLNAYSKAYNCPAVR